MRKLKKMRTNKGYTQKQLSEYSGISIRVIQDYEQGHLYINNAKADSLRSIAKVLECHIEDLLEE